MFQAVVDFLEARGVDTSALRQRQLHIQNTHTINVGDNASISAGGSLSIGTGATATSVTGQGPSGAGGR